MDKYIPRWYLQIRLSDGREATFLSYEEARNWMHSSYATVVHWNEYVYRGRPAVAADIGWTWPIKLSTKAGYWRVTRSSSMREAVIGDIGSYRALCKPVSIPSPKKHQMKPLPDLSPMSDIQAWSLYGPGSHELVLPLLLSLSAIVEDYFADQSWGDDLQQFQAEARSSLWSLH